MGRYDPKTKRVDWTFETAQEGTHMVLASRDGSKLFTTNMGSNTVSVISRGEGDQWRQTLISVGAGPEALAAALREDVVKWGRVVKAAGIKID